MQCTGGDHETAPIDLAYAVVANPDASVEAVAGHAEHTSAYVRWAVADRVDLPQHTYDRLAMDPVPGIRGAVAGNRAIDEPLIRALAGDDTYDVRRRLAHNPAIPLDVLAQIAPITKIGATLLPRIAAATPDEVHALARSPVPALRMLLAERADLPHGRGEPIGRGPRRQSAQILALYAKLTDR